MHPRIAVKLRSNRCRIVPLLTLCLLSGCLGQNGDELPTPIPAEFLPTAIALTLQASGIEPSTSTSSPSPTSFATPSNQPTNPPPTPTSTITATNSPTTWMVTPLLTTTFSTVSTTIASIPSPTTFEISLPFSPVETPPPAIPEAHIQIYKLGELSLVTSPIQVVLHLTERIVNVLRIELMGENGRLLARQVKTFVETPWGASRVDVNLEFEISAAAELSRLVVSAEDQFSRLVDVNSVNLILLSTGMTKLNPASALSQRIIIQEPQPKALIQGGKLIVSGRARPNSDLPLRVILVTEEGKIVGQRLAGVSISIPGDYGTYTAEVPYSVDDLVSALLTVYEDGQPISEFSHLASMEVILAP